MDLDTESLRLPTLEEQLERWRSGAAGQPPLAAPAAAGHARAPGAAASAAGVSETLPPTLGAPAGSAGHGAAPAAVASSAGADALLSVAVPSSAGVNPAPATAPGSAGAELPAAAAAAPSSAGADAPAPAPAAGRADAGLPAPAAGRVRAIGGLQAAALGGSAGRAGAGAGAAQLQAPTEEAEVERLKAQREVELREAAEVRRCWKGCSLCMCIVRVKIEALVGSRSSRTCRRCQSMLVARTRAIADAHIPWVVAGRPVLQLPLSCIRRLQSLALPVVAVVQALLQERALERGRAPQKEVLM